MCVYIRVCVCVCVYVNVCMWVSMLGESEGVSLKRLCACACVCSVRPCVSFDPQLDRRQFEVFLAAVFRGPPPLAM